MRRAMDKDGFTFIETISPCPVGFGKSNNIGDGMDEMWLYRRNSVIDPDVDLSLVEIDMGHESKIVLGNFVDIERPVYGAGGGQE